jgi:hypothetical protein
MPGVDTWSVRASAASSVVAARVPFRRTGAPGWIILAGVVCAWDLAAPETLSNAFRRTAGTPAGRAVLAATWGYLTVHLFGVIPASRDPLYLAHQAWARHRLVQAA